MANCRINLNLSGNEGSVYIIHWLSTYGQGPFLWFHVGMWARGRVGMWACGHVGVGVGVGCVYEATGRAYVYTTSDVINYLGATRLLSTHSYKQMEYLSHTSAAYSTALPPNKPVSQCGRMHLSTQSGVYNITVRMITQCQYQYHQGCYWHQRSGEVVWVQPSSHWLDLTVL